MSNIFKIFFVETLPYEDRELTTKTITKLYNLKIETIEIPKNKLKYAYNQFRGQYNAGRILEDLAKKYRDFLFLMDDDIYVEHLNFVFGVAYIGIGAIISTYRLRLEADKELYHERLVKTIKHELGHYFGLKHCNNNCVMKFANSLYELDIKAENYCSNCQSLLRSRLSMISLR